MITIHIQKLCENNVLILLNHFPTISLRKFLVYFIKLYNRINLYPMYAFTRIYTYLFSNAKIITVKGNKQWIYNNCI